MKVGDLVKYKVQDGNVSGERTGLITELRRNSMNSSDKYTTYYVYWPHLGYVIHADHSDLKVINESR